jgi:primosomal protein N' (replication factor Y)
MADRLVEVAVDAPGVRGGQTFTYRVPPVLGAIGPGDAVVVEYGRQPTIGVVLGEVGADGDGLLLGDEATRGLGLSAAREIKPILDRIGDESLLPPLTARLIAWVALHYLAPPGMVVRQALPPGHFEEIELVALPAVPADAPAFGAPVPAARSPSTKPLSRLDQSLLRAIDAAPNGLARDEVAAIPEQERDLDARLTSLAERELIRLRWRFPAPRPRARAERLVSITDEGREAADTLEVGEPLEGRPLGPRQRALLAELASLDTDEPVPAAQLAVRHGGSAVLGLVRRGYLELGSRSRLPETAPGGLGSGTRSRDDDGTPDEDATTGEPDGAAIRARIVEAVAGRAGSTFLLEGAAAERWRIEADAIEAALAIGRTALVLVPEIALASVVLERLPAGTPIAFLHSGLSEGERADAWQRIRSGAARVVVGTRLATLAPIDDVGVVVVEEEQDAAYKSERTPRYHGRDVAIQLGTLAGAPVVLGSGTPDLVSVGRARAGEISRQELLGQAQVSRPSVELIDLRDELASGNRGLLSTPLLDAIESLDRADGQQAILVLNRRGSASVVMCRDCGYVQVCPECERPLVFHAAQMALRCHHCGATAPVAKRCPACGSPRIRYLGGGTQRVEHELTVRFPDLRIGRLDRDVVERRGSADRIVEAFADGRIDVLVGTGLVARRVDLPQAHLVGVVSADVALSLPDDRAAERTWQLLEQAIGRAKASTGRVLIQTYRPDHPVIEAVATGDRTAFVDAELDRRRRFGSPPFGSLIKLTVALEDRDAALATARQAAERWRDRGRGTNVAVLGPVPAYVARRADRWRFHVVLRGDDPRSILGEDPGPPWSIDVDPESLL